MSLSKTFTAEHVGELLEQVTAWLSHNRLGTTINVGHPGIQNDPVAMTNNVIWNETGETAADDETAVPNVNAPAADKNGMPWDARIHAGSKGVNKDGTWRYKKGAPKELITAVEAEIRSRLAAGHLTNVVVGQQPPMQQPIYQQPQMQQPNVNAMPSPAFPMPSGGVPPMPAGDGGFVGQQPPMQQPVYQQPQMQQSISFGEFMQRFVKLTQTTNPATGQPAINQNSIPPLCQYIGQMVGQQLNAITDIANNPTAIAIAVNKLIADGVWHLVN